MMAEATPRPWRVAEQIEASRIWIEGPEGSAATEKHPKDRRVICDFALYDDEYLDAETRANLDLIVERVNGGE